MDTISYSTLRAKLSNTLDRVNADHTPVIITRQNGKPAVLMSLDDFNAYEATFYLMRSPENAKRLNAAISEVEAGKLIEKELIEE